MSYAGLLADLYDQLYPVSEAEIKFYQYWLTQVAGIALEIGCGTGNVLLPLRAAGFDVDGIDISPQMLCKLRTKAEALGIHVDVFEQSMQHINLDKKYSTIFVSSCAFMLVSDYNQARQALKRFYDHLAPGGQLLISLFDPAKEQVNEKAFVIEREIEHDGRWVTVSRAIVHDYAQQVRKSVLKLDEYQAGSLVRTHEFEFVHRWYSKHEFGILLEEFGFIDIKVFGDYRLQPASDTSEVYIFRALKR